LAKYPIAIYRLPVVGSRKKKKTVSTSIRFGRR